MYATGSKKMLNMLILDILKEYSDEEHKLTQQEIIRLLKKNYDMDCDRRSVKNNVLCLKELGYEISMENGYYLMEREFEDSELRMLIDSVLANNSIPRNQTKDLIEKLMNQSNRYFNAKVTHISNLPEFRRWNKSSLIYNVGVIDDAISEKKKIKFTYNDYGTDFKLHPRRESKYIVNPYQMVVNNGFYYMIANYDKYDDVSHYRIDRITDVEVLDEKRKSMKQVEGLENGLNLPKHMAEHIYMFSGESVSVQMLATKHLMNELVDWFGNDFRITNKNGDNIFLSLKCNEDAMFYWALQYGPYVEVLEPARLRERITDAVEHMKRKYN